MKTFTHICILAAVSLLVSCLKEDIVTDPVVNSVEMYIPDVNKQDSLVTSVPAGKEVKILVRTTADMVSVWPGGIRAVMKKKNSTADSIDMFNHPVLEVSDHYMDYGLVKARGLRSHSIGHIRRLPCQRSAISVIRQLSRGYLTSGKPSPGWSVRCLL